MKRIQRHFELILVILLFLLASSQTTAATSVESNVVYGMHGGLALLMDVYQPDNANGYAIIVIPGSGWHQPRSYDATPLNKPDEISLKILGRDVLLENGYTLFIPKHRSAPLFRYPAAVEDVQRAVRFVRHQAERYHIDPAHIGAIGHSSGGHLLACLG